MIHQWHRLGGEDQPSDHSADIGTRDALRYLFIEGGILRENTCLSDQLSPNGGGRTYILTSVHDWTLMPPPLEEAIVLGE